MSLPQGRQADQDERGDQQTEQPHDFLFRRAETKPGWLTSDDDHPAEGDQNRKQNHGCDAL